MPARAPASILAVSSIHHGLKDGNPLKTQHYHRYRELIIYLGSTWDASASILYHRYRTPSSNLIGIQFVPTSCGDPLSGKCRKVRKPHICGLNGHARSMQEGCRKVEKGVAVARYGYVRINYALMSFVKV